MKSESETYQQDSGRDVSEERVDTVDGAMDQDSVPGPEHNSHAYPSGTEERERNLPQALSNVTIESAYTMENSPDRDSMEDSNSVLGAVGIKIAKTAALMKDAVIQGTRQDLVAGPDDSAEASILVHSVLD